MHNYINMIWRGACYIMELKHIRFFNEVAKLEHITKAAEQLMVSQPFLTKSIKQLETELGVPLFDHVGRKIKLNNYGLALYVHTKNIMFELENAHAEIKDMADRLSNTVSIVTNVGLYTIPLWANIQKSAPQFNMIQSSSKRSNIIAALQTGASDFALCAPNLESDRSMGIVSEIILQDGVFVYFSPNHPLKHRESVDITELAGLDYYTSPKGYGMRDGMDIAFAKANVEPRIVLETTDTSSVIHYVNIGMGFAFIPISIVNYNPDLIKDRCSLTGYDYCQTSISWNERVYKTKAQHMYIEVVRNHFRAMQNLVPSPPKTIL